MIELVAVVIRVQPDAGHVMLLDTTAQVFFPVRQKRIDRSKRDKPYACMRAAFMGEAGIDRRQVLMEQAIKAAGPSLDHAVGTQILHQGGSVIMGQTATRPARQVDIYINDG